MIARRGGGDAGNGEASPAGGFVSCNLDDAKEKILVARLPVARLSIDKRGIGMTRTVRSPARWTEYQ